MFKLFAFRYALLAISYLTLTLSIGLFSRPAFAESEPDKKYLESCNQNIKILEISLDNTINKFLTISNLITNKEMGLANLIKTIKEQTIVAINNSPSPWPTLHKRARLAKVPVMMYHDILARKKVSFDLTKEQFEYHLKSIKENGLTPINFDQLIRHLRTGEPLPEKPIVLTFDDGYIGHYEIVYPLLKKYNYPALFSIYTDKVDGKKAGRSTVTWEQLQEMVTNPLVTIASHSVTHPRDLTKLSDRQVEKEMFKSKQILEEKLGIKINYFTYPEGHYDKRVSAWAKAAGYTGAITMKNDINLFSNESKSLLAIDRFGQSALNIAIDETSGGLELPSSKLGFDFNSQISKHEISLQDIPLILISGGKPITIHADNRYQVKDILAESEAIAGVDGTFFSLERLDSNQVIGPILSQSTKQFVPGDKNDYEKIKNRPLVLISDDKVDFIPFDAELHNTIEGLQKLMPNVQDAFVGAGFLVRNSQPQPAETFGDLFKFNELRHRAFWGIHRSGQPIVGVSYQRVGSVELGQLLAQAGFRDAIMLDSGASTSLAYNGESLVRYTPRPVPHVVGLVPPKLSCIVVQY
ncbi:polysaccharide deacetylase family protein [Okeania sp.]|uniref:polysaccharide deacetylase family protein n=1 Tax=Okeania sp. TaxID=3100323 RepID=UPI002B4B1633|nr:polysaccharide deacetylase family protein [Okeania sp.]MEB3340279.1 polysaccharide deacetylase family protein [Okeania sp.]